MTDPIEAATSRQDILNHRRTNASPEDSRTAVVGRKRKPTVGLGEAEKRPRLENNDDYVAFDDDFSRRNSRESGEISTSHDESGNDFPPQAARRLSDRVASRVTPISDDPEIGNEMTLADVKPADFRDHIRKRTATGDLSVEDAVRECCANGMPFRSRAVAFMRDYSAKNANVRPVLPQTLDLAEIERRLLASQARQLYKPMDLNMLQNIAKQSLYTAVKTEMKQNKSTAGPPTVVGTLLGFAKRGPAFKQQAKKALEDYLNKNWLAASTAGQAAGPSRRRSSGEDGGQPQRYNLRSMQPETEMTAGPAASSGVGGGKNAPIDLTGDDDSVSKMELSCSDSSEDEDEDSPDSYDYGSLARYTAASADPNTTENGKTHMLTLGDISEHDQKLQNRYFHLVDPNDYVRCLSCGEQGHMQNTCPARTCTHCGVFGEHMSSACPTHSKCGRCRQRGHDMKACKNRPTPGGGAGDACDVCSRHAHVEEECPGLWRTFISNPATTTRIPSHVMRVGCYNCGSDSHWGDDCSSLPGFIRNTGKGIWSAESAAKYLDDAEGNGAVSFSERGDREHAQAYQLAQFDDMRD